MSSSTAETTIASVPEVSGHDDRRLHVVAWILFGLTMAGAIASIGFDVAAGHGPSDPSGLVFLAYPAVGIVLATRRPHNPLGWLMLAAAIGFVFPANPYAAYAMSHGRHDTSGAALALAIGAPTWIPFIGLSGFMLLLFPDGHLPSRRWRWFAWLCGIGLSVLFVWFLLAPGTFADSGYPQLRNPLGIDSMKPFFDALLPLLVFAPLTVAGGAAGLIVRRRRSTDRVEREQIRWVAWAAGVTAALYVLAFITNVQGVAKALSDLVAGLAVASFVLIPVTIGIAVLKYRLWNIDIVVRKTAVYGILAVLIVAVGVVLVWVTSSLFASTVHGGRLDLVAGVAIGVLFWPLRSLATRIADRIVFGGRATPYEVLSAFGDRIAGTYAADDVLPRTARVLAEGVGADRAHVWLATGDALTPVASWARDGVDPDGPDDHRVEVRYQGEVLGALSVAMPANDPMDPAKEQLVADLAAQAGLLLRNVRLVEDLRASRRRLVTAQDGERRRLERNIHDGAQQQLVALAVKARLARQLTERDPAKATEMLTQIEAETQQALEDLRDLARGIYPPLLADKGLVPALEAQARRSTVPVTLETSTDERFDRDVEAAVYFSVLEALQNVAKYAHANATTVRLAHEAGTLTFTVTDDGRGFDPAATGYGTGLQGIADRLGALDGSIAVESAPGVGTTLTGRLPAMPLATEVRR